jgi:hypothetical protein
VYEPTQAGRAVHAAWLRTPVEVSTVARDLGLHLMRFVMMEHASSREEVLEHGLAVYRASLRWTRHAIAALGAAPAPSSQPSSGSQDGGVADQSQLFARPLDGGIELS